MACCSCCEKTGACCTDGVCSQTTCADCAGEFQGVDTECIGVDECPCDPPSSPLICEKCVAGVPTDYCPATDCCTDGTCKPCPPPYCPEEPCTGTDCCVDGQCVPCPEPTCPTVACTGGLCCVDGFCVPCPDYDCVPECESGDCCVDGVCEPCTACDPGDCPSGQCCVDGFCTDCPDPCDPGDCGPGYCCVDGFCLPCPPRECPDPPCPSGECCIDGYCINPCPAGECCVGGECEPCGCSGECDIATEVVYFGNQTGSHLQLDGDSFPICSSGAALPEVISGSFALGTVDGCNGASCGCEVKFRFWRNLFSPCDSGSNSDITTQTVEVECTAGSVNVRTSGGDVPLDASESHVFNTIDFDSSNGAVPYSGAGECFSVAAVSSTASFTVTATLDWTNSTDHDLYGEVSCGGCA